MTISPLPAGSWSPGTKTAEDGPYMPEKHADSSLAARPDAEIESDGGTSVPPTTIDHDSDSTESVGWGAKQTARLLRKVDLHLLPFLSLLYLFSFLDRTNIGNSKLANLERDIGINPTSISFNIAVAVLFPFYVSAEIPSNLMMRRVRPSLWIPFIMVAWGLCCISMGFVKSFGGLVAARCALGFTEGGLFPGVTYYITLWYNRKECGLRMAIFFSAATAAGAFGGLLARAIVELDGYGGLAGWSWIFILEGSATVLVALLAFWVMNDYPDTARFLTADEGTEIRRRLQQDRLDLDNEFNRAYIWQAMTDWKIWVHMLITIGIFTPLYSIATFMPTIVKDLGYSDAAAQLMSAPPYLAACATCIVGGWGADRHGQRGVWMIGFCIVALVGFGILMGTSDIGASYLACVLVTCGIYANVPQGVAWNGNNIGGATKRGVGMAMQIGFGNLGGVISGFVYRTGAIQQGHVILFSTTAMSCSLCVAMTLVLRRENARRDSAYKKPSDFGVEERMEFKTSGDAAPFFRYVV